MIYDNEHDGAQYLRGSIVHYENRPYYVESVQMVPITRQMTCRLACVGRADVHYPTVSVALEDPGLNVMNLRLGYINYRGSAYYLMRKGVRGDGFKQGLTQANVTCHPVPNGWTGGRLREFIATLLASQSHVDLCAGKWPSLKEAHDEFQRTKSAPNPTTSIAISRHFAIEFDPDMEDYTLLHRGEKVARAHDIRSFRLSARNKFLEESLKMETQIDCPKVA